MNSPYSAGVQGNTIVVVDDEPWLLLLMQDVVEDMGFSSRPFTQVDDALAFLMTAPDDVRLILTDFSTPGSSNGVDLATKAASSFPLIPVIVTSGYMDAAFALPAGTAFIPKPWSVEAITTLIKKLTDKPNA